MKAALKVTTRHMAFGRVRVTVGDGSKSFSVDTQTTFDHEALVVQLAAAATIEVAQARCEAARLRVRPVPATGAE